MKGKEDLGCIGLSNKTNCSENLSTSKVKFSIYFWVFDSILRIVCYRSQNLLIILTDFYEIEKEMIKMQLKEKKEDVIRVK